MTEDPKRYGLIVLSNKLAHLSKGKRKYQVQLNTWCLNVLLVTVGVVTKACFKKGFRP